MSNRSTLRATQPTLSLAGEEKPALSSALLSMLLEENTDGLFRCEALFGNWGASGQGAGFLYFDRRTLDFGQELQVKFGQDVAFTGRISGLEANYPEDGAGTPELNVLAEDRLQDLRMTRRTRSFEDVSDADLLRRFANEHGLQPEINVNGPTHKSLAQVNQSDLAFLRERARAIDAELWVEDRKLFAQSRARRGQDTLQLTYKFNLREFSVLADLARQATGVTVSGWDVAAKAALSHEATKDAIGNELNGDLSGVQLLADKFGTRREALTHTVPLTGEETQAAAEAWFRRGARRFVVGRGVAETQKRLRVGGTLDLQGLGPLFNGKYYVCAVKHRFDRVHGLRTEFTVERPGIGRG
ncbi:MAG: phage late control D family protein [Acidobacteria bacterium]|nr:phage late control D family protein [Acidobacteriota bacterium]MBI3428096.1 phage late control D family protein [Acidobacteriota bacterium]